MVIHTKKLGARQPSPQWRVASSSLPIIVSDERAHWPLDGGHLTQNSEEQEIEGNP